jgi:hypothetical protein
LISCPALARDIARLTALLGPDVRRPAGGADQQRTKTEGMLDRSADFASDAAARAPDLAAEDTARDTIVGLNPARPVVRFLGGAGEIEAAAARERELALKRRAWLRGVLMFRTVSGDPDRRAWVPITCSGRDETEAESED